MSQPERTWVVRARGELFPDPVKMHLSIFSPLFEGAGRSLSPSCSCAEEAEVLASEKERSYTASQRLEEDIRRGSNNRQN